MATIDMKRTMRPIFCLALMVLTLTGCDRLRSVETIASRGEAQYQKGNYRAAVADFKTALERDGNNVKAFAGLARVSYHLGDFAAAQDAVEAALTKGSADEDLPSLKYQILLARQDYQGMQASLITEKKLSAVDRLRYTGLAEFGLGQADAARDTFNQALALKPDDVAVLLARARLAAGQNDLAAAMADVDSALGHSRDSADAWLLKGSLLTAKSDLQNAKIALEKAESLSKTQLNWYEQARLYGLLTDLSLRRRDQAEAARWLNALSGRAAKSPVTLYLKARLALLQDNANDALVQLQMANREGNYLPARMLLANLLLTKASYGQAEEQLNGLLKDYPGNIEVRKLLAQLYLATRRAEDARKILPEGEVGQAPDAQTDWLRGQAMLATGARDAGVALLEKSVKADPADVNRSLQLARTYVMAGDRDKAVALLTTLPVGAGKQRQDLLVVASVMGKPLAEARRELDELLAHNPQDSELHAAAAVTLAQLGDVDHAAALFDKAIQLDATNLDARLGLATVRASARRYDEAEALLREVLRRDGKQLRARLLLANIALVKGDRARAIKELEQAVGTDATAIEPRLQLARLAFADNDIKRGRTLIDQAVTVSNNTPAVLDAAGRILFQARQFEDALARYEQAIAAGNLASRLGVAEAHLALGQQAEARQALELAAGEAQTRVAALTKLVALDAKAGQVDKALDRIEQLTKDKLPAVLLDEMRGDVYAQAKRYDSAVKYYDNVSQRSPSQRLALKEYQLRVAGNLPDPVAPLTAWVARQPKDATVLRVLAQHALAVGDNPAAVRYLEQVLAALPVRDPGVLNDLAWAYQLTKDKRAETMALEAYKALPAEPAVADTYGWVLLQAGKNAEALSILQKVANSKRDPEIQYHLAAAQARMGQNEAARNTLQSALTDKQAFASRTEAEKLMATLTK